MRGKMKVKVWDESKDEEGVLQLRLVQDSSGVRFVVVDGKGNPKNEEALVQITHSGKVHFFGGLADDLEIAINEEGNMYCFGWKHINEKENTPNE